MDLLINCFAIVVEFGVNEWMREAENKKQILSGVFGELAVTNVLFSFIFCYSLEKVNQ